MEPATLGSPRVRLGSFELDLRTGELRSFAPDSPTDKVLLREQPFQILLMLVERAGKIVTRAEIQKQLWPNDTVVDWDHSINVAVGVLRRALGDSAARPQYIETLARRGYRLIAPVEWLESRVAAGDPDAVRARLPPSDLTGQTVSHYRVLGVLGGGGMGKVYEAEDLRLGRRAALKFLPQELALDPVALKRLEREAQTASALNHPNICTIYDIDDYEGQRFIAMELLEGETLEQRLASAAPDPLPPAELIDIAMQACVGLEAAHGKDIVHRDIKPANLFLTRQGTVKVLDFGIAKQVTTEELMAAAVGAVEVAADVARAAAPLGLTRTGATVGTTGYMSPEQVRKERLDGRSDLFSLGLVIYEMATGRRAFTGESPMAVQDAILTTSPPAVDTVNPAVPHELAAIVGTALEKERSLRYQSAANLRRDLERARDTGVRPSRGRAQRWWVAAAAAAALAVAAALIWISSRVTSAVSLAENDTIVLADLTNSTTDHAFDDALYTALRMSFEQTPYLNVLSNDKLQSALAAVKIEQGTRITPEIALEVCRQTSSRVLVAPSIAEKGNRLVVGLESIDCRSGSVLSRIERDAAIREDVVAALGDAAVEMRRDLGEPASSLAQYNAELEQATSSSPDALELLRLGYRRQLMGDVAGAIPFYERAVRTDPSFALAHTALSIAHFNLGQTAPGSASAIKAFELRDRLTAPARFQVESTYHLNITGDAEAACAVMSQWVAAFPHDVIGRNNFGRCLQETGDLDRGLGQLREAARLRPSPYSYQAWVHACLMTDRWDEAQKVLDEAFERGFDIPLLHDLRARLAFHRNDEAAMQEEWAWAAGRTDTYAVLIGKAYGEIYRGRLRAALAIAATASEMAPSPGAVSDLAVGTALWYTELGLTPAQPIVVASNETMSTRFQAALALARSGQEREARKVAAALRSDFPSHTLVQRYGLPVIEGAIALASGDGPGAVAALEPAARYDVGSPTLFESLWVPYLRGQSRLLAGEAALAAADFQKILDHPGLAGRTVIVPLATLHLARAQRAMGADTAALQSYGTFLDLWRDADSDLPVYRDAKAERQALHDRLGSAVSAPQTR